MYHIGRCGSSVLGNLLHQHPAIRWDREIYFHRWTRSNRRLERWDSESFLRRSMWAAGRRYYGFEIKFLDSQHLLTLQLSLAEYIAELARVGVTHHVILERRNTLRVMLSSAAGTRNKRHHAATDAPAGPPERVRLDVARWKFWKHTAPKPLVDCLADVSAAYAELRRRLTDQNVLELSFEDDIAAESPHAAYSRTCAFLELSPAPAEIHTRRLHPEPLSALIENFDEVADALRGTPYEWMLAD